MRLLVSMLLLSLGNLLAQEPKFTVRIDWQSHEGESSLVLLGTTDLPEQSVLALSLSFAGEEIPWTWRKVVVQQDGRFSFTYGPFNQRILSGLYELTVRYLPFLQSGEKDWNKSQQKFPFYWGSQTQEMAENHEYREAIRRAVQEFGALQQEMRETIPRYREMPAESLSAAQQWAGVWAQRRGNLENELRSLNYPKVLAPHRARSLRDLEAISLFSELLFRQQWVALCQHWGARREESDGTAPPPLVVIHAADYEQEIAKRYRNIAEREGTTETLDYADLHTDLLYFNRLYEQLTRAYRHALISFSPANWTQTLEEWRKEADRFSSAAASYPHSPLGQRYPELPTLLADLSRLLFTLEKSYTVHLGEKHGQSRQPAPPKESMGQLTQALQERFATACRIVQVEKEIVEKEKRSVGEKIGQEWEKMQSLERELEETHQLCSQGPDGLTRWQQWQVKWNEKLRRSQQIESDWAQDSALARHAPQAKRFLMTARLCLESLADQYTQELQGQRQSGDWQRIRYFKRVYQKMQQELTEAGKR